MGQPPQITAFTGEQAVTAALIEVTEGKKSSAYYVQGHGEPAIGKGKPLEVLGTLLDGEHLTVGELNLLNVDTIPADASVVMLLGPRYDLTDREIGLLSAYWDKGGAHPSVAQPRRADAASRRVSGQARHQTRRRPRVAHAGTGGAA